MRVELLEQGRRQVGGGVPHTQRSVVATRGEPRPIGRESDGPDGAAVHVEILEQGRRQIEGGVPHTQRSGIATRGEPHPIG